MGHIWLRCSVSRMLALSIAGLMLIGAGAAAPAQSD